MAAKKRRPKKGAKKRGGTKRKAQANWHQFVDEYLSCGRNGAHAYRTVWSHVKETTARSEAAKLLANPNVQEYLAQREAELLEALNVNQLSVLGGLKKLGFFDIRKLFNKNGSLKAPHEIDDETAAALASIEVEELFAGSGKEREQVGWTKKVKVYDRGQNLERLGRTLGLFNADKSQTPAALPPRIEVVFVKSGKKS